MELKKVIDRFKEYRYKRLCCRMLMRSKNYVLITDVSWEGQGKRFKYRIRMYGLLQPKIRRRLLEHVFSIYRKKLIK
jgi:hypothetical protein